MSEQPSVAVETSYNTVKVFIDGVLHLCFPRKYALQSWRDHGIFVIEITSEAGYHVVEYDDEVLWKRILSGIETVTP